MKFLTGRTNRAVYWLCIVLIAAIMAALNFIAPNQAKISEVVLVFVSVPRLHDLGRSGWWVLIPLALEVGAIAVSFLQDLSLDQMHITLGAVVIVIGLLMILLGVLPGQREPNRFGPPPAPGLGRKRASP
jgi:uncharacterized membrane protein YhaH (DUF805 family)